MMYLQYNLFTRNLSFEKGTIFTKYVMHLARDRIQWLALANAVLNLGGFIKDVGDGNLLTGRGTISFSIRILLHKIS
jgi:hypothetical protein